MSNQYLDKNGLEHLINLVKDNLAEKQNVLQFKELPSAVENPGKIYQYIGKSKGKYNKGFYYYSNGVSWQPINIMSDKPVAVVDCEKLPEWNLADAGIIYYITTSELAYVKDVEQENYWYNLNEVYVTVSELPEWSNASNRVIYLIADKNTGEFDGYIKGVEQDMYFRFGGTTNYNKLENTPTINGISTVNEKDPTKPKNIQLNVLSDGEPVPVDELELSAIQDEQINGMFED